MKTLTDTLPAGCRQLAPKPPTVVEQLDAAEAKRRDGAWFPASGGTEEPFVTRTGRRLQYCWQPSTGDHAYLDCGTDLILSDEDAMQALGTF